MECRRPALLATAPSRLPPFIKTVFCTSPQVPANIAKTAANIAKSSKYEPQGATIRCSAKNNYWLKKVIFVQFLTLLLKW